LTLAAVSAWQCQHGLYQQFLLQHSVRRPLQSQSVWRPGCFPIRQGDKVMTSIDTEGSSVSESEISATLVSLRECFEGVRRDVTQRVRGRLGSLSPDQENAIDLLSHGIIEKVLEAPVAMLQNASEGNQTVFVLETVRRIFNLRT
jgi:Glutamyl-tRNAGlu reductase, dimerisation domain